MSDNSVLTRAELVRKRRQEQDFLLSEKPPSPPQKPTRHQRAKIKQNQTAGSKNRSLPPLTARGVVNDFEFERRKNYNQHRFNAVLSLPRPTLLAQDKPLLRLRFGWRFLSFLLLVLFGTALYLLWSLPQFHVNAARVTGNQHIPADEINAVLGLNGSPVIFLAPDQIEAVLYGAFPELISVEATVRLPNTLTVNITERQPIIKWRQDGNYTWIDETGVAIRPRGDLPGLITVEALSAPPNLVAPENPPQGQTTAPTPYISLETVKAIQILSTYIPEGTVILYDSLAGLSWNDGRGWQAVFGNSVEDMALKVRVYQTLVDWLIQRNIQPSLINVAYPNAPFYRLDHAGSEVQTLEETMSSEAE